MSKVTRDQIVAVTAVKRFLKLVTEYRGPRARLRTYLIRKLQKMDTTADWILAEAFTEILPSQ